MSVSFKNIRCHDFIMMVEQKNMDLEFQLLLTVRLARKAQVTESSRTELPSYCLPGFQVPFIGKFSPVTYVTKDTHRCEFNRCAFSYW